MGTLCAVMDWYKYVFTQSNMRKHDVFKEWSDFTIKEYLFYVHM